MTFEASLKHLDQGSLRKTAIGMSRHNSPEFVGVQFALNFSIKFQCLMTFEASLKHLDQGSLRKTAIGMSRHNSPEFVGVQFNYS